MKFTRRQPYNSSCRPAFVFALILLVMVSSQLRLDSGVILLSEEVESSGVRAAQRDVRNETADSITTTTKDISKTTITIWSQARGDRSGAFIQDMLMCHAYAYHNNMVYGGACARNTNMRFKLKHRELLRAVGLSKVLRFGCPPDDNTRLQERIDYIKDDTGIFTPHYLEYLQTLVEYPPPRERRRISVHIRRGDITPCRPRTRGYPRYLPNQHFLRLIDRYNPQNNSDVVIYSESPSYETFDCFRQRGYEVVLDGSIGEAWKGILMSDVVILSRSSFSLVPAILTKGTVVFTPFWHDPLPHWDIVEESFVNETLTEFRRLKATCPKKEKKK